MYTLNDLANEVYESCDSFFFDVKFVEIIPQKIIFAEDDRLEYPCITFKMKPGMKNHMPYLSVFRGNQELESVFIQTDFE